MIRFQNDNFHTIYQDTLTLMLEEGELWAKSIAVPHYQFVLTDPANSLINHPKNWAWAFTEMIDRLSFDETKLQNPGTSYEFRPNWKKKLIKEGGIFCYSYGEEIDIQLPYIMKKLKRSAEREAIFSMWEPDMLISKKPRRPCTLNLHFINLNGVLHASCMMRTVDVMNLLPYDIFHHTMLQRYIAGELGLKLGHFSFQATFAYFQKKRLVTGSVDSTIKRLKYFKRLPIPSFPTFNEEDRQYLIKINKALNSCLVGDLETIDLETIFMSIETQTGFKRAYGSALIWGYLKKLQPKVLEDLRVHKDFSPILLKLSDYKGE